jgi:cyclic pyranopterin monophosphate synthase
MNSAPHPLYAFEADDGLSLLPLAARRALDVAGERLSLEGWRSLPPIDRQAIAEAGASGEVDASQIRATTARAIPAPQQQPPLDDPDPETPPPALLDALGPERPLEPAQWASLRPIDRYALAKLCSRDRAGRLTLAYEEALRALDPPPLTRPTHLNERGEARMVDVGQKAASARRAVATARIRMAPSTLAQITAGGAPKGDVFGVARIAGIMAAKKTPELIPLCHGLSLTRVDVAFDTTLAAGEVVVRATAEALDRTGVEMEAMVAASIAALTIYDMVKSIDRWMTVGEVRLEEKSGGKSGRLVRGEE